MDFRPEYLIAGLAAWVVGSYIYDVVLLPTWVAKKARKEADSLGMPLLNVGAGTGGSSLRAATLGPTLWGDVNVDIAAPKHAESGPDRVSHGDVHNLPFPDNHFGACIASHLLEHVDDPKSALKEMERVTLGNVYVVVPKWWAPHTWLYTDHQWFIGQDGTTYPLWRR